MKKKHQVHNLIILDESGSMQSIKKTIIEGFNEIVQTVKGIEKRFPEQEHFISLLTFNSSGNKLLHFMEPVNKLGLIDEKKYHPNESTPLYDAMGFGFAKLIKALENQTDYDVLVTIMTDGMENASREYSGDTIKKLIEELKLKHWTFTYIGADHNVEEFASSISISNHMVFEKNVGYMRNMFSSEMQARENFSQNIRDNKDTSDDFYLKEDKTI